MSTTNNRTFLHTMRKYANGSVLLIMATILALFFANLPATRDAYAQLWQLPVSVRIGSFDLFSHGGHQMTLMDFINDYLMALFFLCVGLEIKREVLCGELSTRQKAMLPVIGACGGMLIPVVIFYLVCAGHPMMERGCAIPMATDIAFSLGVLSLFGKRVPVGLKIFLAALAVADDLGGIIVIAIFYTEHMAWSYMLGALTVVALLLLCNYRGLRIKGVYLGLGLVLWYLVLNTGIHATIAGVVLAFCIPSDLGRGTRFYLQRIRKLALRYPEIVVSEADRKRTVVISKDDVQLLRSIEEASDHLISPLQDMEDNLSIPVNMVIIPLFAFANAGVDFSGMSLLSLFHGVALGVFLGLLVGKFLGVLSFSWISMKLGLCQMPNGADWRSFMSVCMVCGIGFTVSMFIAALSYLPVAELGGAEMLNEAKLGIMAGSLASGIVGCILLHFTLPKEPVED